jgi:AcrR family transcriptional regulator
MIHYYFHDRDSLIKYTLEHYLKPFSESVWETVDLDLGPLEMLKEMFFRLQNIITIHPWYISFWGREMINLDGKVRDYMKSLIEPRRLKAFKEKIEEGQRQGLVNPVLLPELIFANILACSFMPRLFKNEWAKQWQTEITDEMISRHIWAMTLDGLAAKGGRDLR